MDCIAPIALATLTLAGSLANLASAASPQPRAVLPQVAKVEPPGWWPGHSINPVRLLVRGEVIRGRFAC